MHAHVGALTRVVAASAALVLREVEVGCDLTVLAELNFLWDPSGCVNEDVTHSAETNADDMLSLQVIWSQMISPPRPSTDGALMEV